MSIASARAAIRARNQALGALRHCEHMLPPIGSGPLDGLAVSVKDVIEVAGWTTTCNHRPFAERRPVRDAEVVERVRRAGAALVGASTTLEFAYGGFTDQALYGHARNPWNLARSPGGSSAGAAAAAAAGLCDAAIATDTSGSVRGPAALCGVLGLKLTHGSTPARGLYPLADTLDAAGVLARDADVLARVAGVMQARELDARPRIPRRIGWLRGFDEAAGVGGEAASAVQRALDDFADRGAGVCEVATSFPLEIYHAACIGILLHEAWGVHGRRLRAERDGYDPRTWARLAIGAFVSHETYGQALLLRKRLRAEIDGLLEQVEVLVTAAAPAGAGDPAAAPPFGMLDAPFLTTPFSLTGHPAIAMPIGLDRGGMPLSMQLVARMRHEPTLLRAAAAHRRIRPWQTLTPPTEPEHAHVAHP